MKASEGFGFQGFGVSGFRVSTRAASFGVLVCDGFTMNLGSMSSFPARSPKPGCKRVSRLGFKASGFRGFGFQGSPGISELP